MPFQSVPGCASAAIRFTLGTVPGTNVLHFRKNDGEYDLADLQELADAIDPVVASEYLPLIVPANEYVGVEVRGLQEEEDHVATNTDGAGPGTGSGDACANNVSLCLTVRTGFTGRSARGRIYVMPPSVESVVSGTQFDTAYVALAVALFNDIAAAALGANWLMCVVSRFHDNAKREEGTYTLMQSITNRNRLIDSQRGRLANNH